MKKTTILLMLTSALATIVSFTSADTIPETVINPCTLLADASCEVDTNGQINIIGDGSENRPTFDEHKAILVDALETYKVCALESVNKKDLRTCKKSFKKSLRK